MLVYLTKVRAAAISPVLLTVLFFGCRTRPFGNSSLRDTSASSPASSPAKAFRGIPLIVQGRPVGFETENKGWELFEYDVSPLLSPFPRLRYDLTHESPQLVVRTKIPSAYNSKTETWTLEVEGVPTTFKNSFGFDRETWAAKVPCKSAFSMFLDSQPPSNMIDCALRFVPATPDASRFGIVVTPLQGDDWKGNPQLTSILHDYMEPVRKVSAGPLRPELGEVNQQLDEAAYVESAVNIFSKAGAYYSAKAGLQRKGCLDNPLIGSWTDSQAHFYCQIPSVARRCYSEELIAAVESKAGISDPAIRLKAGPQAYAKCIDGSGVDPSQKQWVDQFLTDSDKEVFKYVMFAAPGVADFNHESERKAIEAVYSKLEKKVLEEGGEPSLSGIKSYRSVDSYLQPNADGSGTIDPELQLNSPRYEVIKKLQYCKLLSVGKSQLPPDFSKTCSG